MNRVIIIAHARVIATCFAAAFVAGSATAGTKYERSQAGPLERDQAECRMLAATQEQGYFAFGTTAYVAGAALGNAIANGIRMERFYDNCMIAKGWKKVRTKAAPGKCARAWECRSK